MLFFSRQCLATLKNHSVSWKYNGALRLFKANSHSGRSNPCYVGLLKVLSVKKCMTIKDWNSLQEVYSTSNFTYSAINALKRGAKNLNDLRTFFEACETSNSLTPILKCLCLPVYWKLKEECSNDDVQKILEIYNEVVSSHPILTEEIIECLIPGIMLTPLWRKHSTSLLEHLKKLKVVPGNGYSLYIAGLFYNNKPSLGWKCMQEVFSQGGQINQEVYHSILNYFESKSKPPKIEDVMKLIKFFEFTSLMAPEEISERLAEYFEDHTKTWVARSATVSSRGICSCCSSKLKHLLPSESEMQKLSKSAFSDILQESNAFINSSPEEIKRFQNFLNSCKYYNVVLDGLNVAALRKNPRRRLQQLRSTVNYLKRKGFSVLVIGRQHMLKWTSDVLVHNAQVFLAGDHSKDDPFAIYAAIQNGPKTYLVSKDFMGLHFTKLKPEMQGIFRKWQFSSQILLNKAGMIFPEYSPICQTSMDGQFIHLPVSCSTLSFSPSKWLCLQQVRSEQKKEAHVIWRKEVGLKETKFSSTYRSFASKVIDDANQRQEGFKVNKKI